MMKVYRDIIKTPIGKLSLVSTSKGLSFIGLGDNTGRDADRFIADSFPSGDVESGGRHNYMAEKELREYFAGKLEKFTVGLDLRRTGFTRTALQKVRAIPYGKTRTYGEIASAMGRPRAARAVGAANRSNPIPIVIPCHRVVAANGPGGYGGGVDLKRKLLRMEGAILEGQMD
jgi:O-6-methylguanine DNA methyltransferase